MYYLLEAGFIPGIITGLTNRRFSDNHVLLRKEFA